MQHAHFDRPIVIYFGKPGRTRLVGSVFEAEYCLKSEKWPGKRKRAWQEAVDVVDAVKLNKAMPKDLRTSFERAAREAGIMPTVDDHAAPRR